MKQQLRQWFRQMPDSAGENNRPSPSDSTMDFKRRLPDLVDSSGVSDRQLSLRATGSLDTVRNMPRSSYPRLDALEALCRALGGRLEIVPVGERRKSPRGSRLSRSALHGPTDCGRKSARIRSGSLAATATEAHRRSISPDTPSR